MISDQTISNVQCRKHPQNARVLTQNARINTKSENSQRKKNENMAPNSKNDKPSNPPTESDQSLCSFAVAARTASARTSTVSRDVLGNVLRRRQSGTPKWSVLERPDIVLLLEEALAICDDCSQFDDNDELDEDPSHA
jgi:hypothetical protein